MDTATPIGFRDGRDAQQPVFIPLDIRLQHTHVIGQNGTGKSTLIERMALHDIKGGYGVAVLDPYGNLVERLMRLIPLEYIDRVVYMNPGDPDWVLIWNPLLPRIPVGPGRIADALVRVFAPVAGLGDRPENILRHALLAVLQLPNGNLRDVLDLLRRGSRRGARLLSRVLRVSNDEVTRDFWRLDFARYSSFDLDRSALVLRRLLTSGPCSRMLSQRHSSFDLREVMDSGGILLADLSAVSPAVRDIIGSWALSLLHLTSLGRQSAGARSLRPFCIHCDGAHRFVKGALEDLIAETRKFGVSLTVAHQRMNQFNARKSDALSSVGSTVIFRIDCNDALHLQKDLHGKVVSDDLITLVVGQAVARIGTQVVQLKTLPPLKTPADCCRDAIIQQSHERYYRPMR